MNLTNHTRWDLVPDGGHSEVPLRRIRGAWWYLLSMIRCHGLVW